MQVSPAFCADAYLCVCFLGGEGGQCVCRDCKAHTADIPLITTTALENPAVTH